MDKTTKVIWHLGAWSRNYGDFALLNGLQSVLAEDTAVPLRFQPVHCQKTWLHPDLIERLNQEADMLLVGGGGLIFNRPEDDSHSGWQFNIRSQDIAKIRVPLVVYAIGYNRFFYDSNGFKAQLDESLSLVQQKSAFFSVRNQGTRDELLGRGLDPARIEVIADPGMYCPASPITLPGLGAEGLKIGVNWAGDRDSFRFPPPVEATRDAVIDALCDALLEALEKHGGGRVVYIPHLRHIDEAAAGRFAERLGAAFYNVIEELPYLYPPSSVQVPFLTDIYRQMDLVVGMRGHANIIPFGTNTPFVALSSHNKNFYFMEEIGEPGNAIDIRGYPETCSPTAMGQVVERALDDAGLKGRMAARHEAARGRTAAFNRQVLALLN